MTNAVLIVLTFIVNFILNYYFWVIMIMLSFIFGYQPAPGTEDEIVLKLTLASILIPGLISQSGLMTGMFVYNEGGRSPSPEDGRYLQECLDDICLRAQLDPKEYHLYIGAVNEYNAFALGKTITVFFPVLRDLPREEVIGIMAHEVGHIQNGHTRTGLLCVGMSWFNTIIKLVFNGIALICRLLFWIPFLGFVLNVFSLFIITIYNIMDMLLYIPTFLINRFGSRQQEYQADAYAAKLGYGPALASGLAKIEAYYGNRKMSIFQRITCDHPGTDARIKAIRKIVEKQQQESGFWDD